MFIDSSCHQAMTFFVFCGMSSHIAPERNSLTPAPSSTYRGPDPVNARFPVHSGDAPPALPVGHDLSELRPSRPSTTSLSTRARVSARRPIYPAYLVHPVHLCCLASRSGCPPARNRTLTRQPAKASHSPSPAIRNVAILKQIALKRSLYRGARKASSLFCVEPHARRLTDPNSVVIVEFTYGATRSHTFGKTESIYRGEGQLSHKGERCVVHGGKVATRSYKRIARLRLLAGPWCAGLLRRAFG